MKKIIDFAMKQEALIQFIKFGMIGVFNTGLTYGLFMLGIFLGLPYLICNAVSWAITVMISYLLNNYFVFKKEEGNHRSTWKAILKVYASYSVTGIFLNSALLFLWIDILHIPTAIAPLINLFISVPVNFLLNKYWAYGDKKIEAAS